MNNYFLTANPSIQENTELREPQILAYERVYEHFISNHKTTHAIVMLPTGVGKTGVMGLLPYGISQGRVLIITPQLVIKDAVLDSLDPAFYDNFWLKRNIFSNPAELPTVVEYDSKECSKSYFIQAMEESNIVIANIQKLQERLKSSLLKCVDNDFFDMIIIDEAHHSTAKTWTDTINYFNSAKVVKLTGTPFRTDNEPIAGEEVFKYKLSQAMAKGYVKSLEKFNYVPDTLFLTLDENDDKKYTLQEIKDMNLKSSDWITRSIAYSTDCSQKVVDQSIELLKEKLEYSPNIPHKIIAVACSIKHAIQIQELYNKKNYPSTIVHSSLSKEEISKNLADIENHRVKVVINVAKLGEGYDHPFLSVAAIFRPFRHLLPYAQFIGRILRNIQSDDIKPTDNIGQVVVHKGLELDKLWEYYKHQIQESEVIAVLDQVKDDNNVSEKVTSSGVKDTTFGLASEEGTGTTTQTPYLTTELIKARNEQLKIEHEKIKALTELLNITPDEAKQYYLQSISNKNDIKRPDLYFKNKSTDLDKKIREDVVPNLIVTHDIDKNGNELKYCSLFKRKNYRWITLRQGNNAAYLAIYFNQFLKNSIGYAKKEWTRQDLEQAEVKLDECIEYVNTVLKEFTKS